LRRPPGYFKLAGMSRVLALLALLALAPPQPAREDPRDILRMALRAAETGNTASLAASCRQRLARDTTDRLATLGLAALARLTYDYPTADRLYPKLAAPGRGVPDRIAVYGRLDQAAAWLARGAATTADSLFALAAREARGAHDPAAEGQALLRRAAPQLRIGGPVVAMQLVSSAQRLIPATDAVLQAELLCHRANVLVVAARQGGRSEPIAPVPPASM
jgi:hypothetical protein